MAEQTLTLPAPSFSVGGRGGGSRITWRMSIGAGIAIDSALIHNAETAELSFLELDTLTSNHYLQIDVHPPTSRLTSTALDFTDAFELQGTITLAYGNTQIVVETGGDDRSGNYEWRGLSEAEIDAFIRAVNGRAGATLTLNDNAARKASVALTGGLSGSIGGRAVISLEAGAQSLTGGLGGVRQETTLQAATKLGQDRRRWTQLGQINPLLVDSDDPVYLARLELRPADNSVLVRLSASPTDSNGNTASDGFNFRYLRSGLLSVTYDGTAIAVTRSELVADPTEPYVWSPADGATSVQDLVDALGANAGAVLALDGTGIASAVARLDHAVEADLDAGLSGSASATAALDHAVEAGLSGGLSGSIEGEPALNLAAVGALTGGLSGSLSATAQLYLAARVTLPGGLAGSVRGVATLSDQRARVALTGGLSGRIVAVGRLGAKPELLRRLEASPKLLIDQWAGASNLNGIVRSFVGEGQVQIDALERMEEMRQVDTAEGVWLDYIGERVGLARPSAEDYSRTFGFDDAGVGFDQGRMRDLGPVQPRTPIGDELYRRMIKARGWLLLGYGNAGYMRRAVREIDPAAIMTDLDDMSFRVTTTQRDEMLIGDKAGALPRPAGVRMVLADINIFGFDDAGVGFDQGRMRSDAAAGGGGSSGEDEFFGARQIHFGHVHQSLGPSDVSFLAHDSEPERDYGLPYTVVVGTTTPIQSGDGLVRPYWAVPTAEGQPSSWLQDGQFELAGLMAPAERRTISQVEYWVYMFHRANAVDLRYNGAQIVMS